MRIEVKVAKSSKRPAKRRTNLTLDPDVVAAAERYGVRHGTNLSRLVNDFLRALRTRANVEGTELSPAVRRLHGIAGGAEVDRAAHRAHLVEKYGAGA